MHNPILTVPEPVKRYRPVFLTGNEFLSLPEIDPRTGGLRSLGVLHMAASGLLEFRGPAGRPFLVPWVRVNGKRAGLARRPGQIRWRQIREWIPSFSCQGPNWLLQGRITAPPGHRGAVYRLTFTNQGREPLELELGWKGCWGELARSVFSTRSLAGPKNARYDSWTESLILEAGETGGLPLAALSLSTPGDSPWQLHFREADRRFDFASCSTALLQPGATRQALLYLAVNRDGDGAGTTGVDLRRRGWARLEEEGEKWLAERFRTLDSPRLTSLMNRNLFFNYFFAQGRTLDTDEPALVTSRSSRYYVSAAFWSRDTLLWSFPGILLLDPRSAREILLTVFDRHLQRAGEHAHYINGSVLYPGFELDQLAAHFLALRGYLDSTGDSSLFSRQEISSGLQVLLAKLFSWQDPASGLFATFLDPSDDPPPYPFLVYANALVCCALSFLAGLQEAGLFVPREPFQELDFSREAERLKKAIYRHGVVSGPRGPLFAWAVDGRGHHQLYDNPPGSLQLLAYYGFCSPEEETYKNTVDWIRSPDNPYFSQEGPIAETGSLHAPDPWPLGAANDLLAQNRGAEEFLHRVSMDQGLACETVHPQSGKARTGLAFATAAGFLGYAIWYRYSRGRSR